MLDIATRGRQLAGDVRKVHGINYPELLARMLEDDQIKDQWNIPIPKMPGYKASDASKRLLTLLSASQGPPGRHFMRLTKGWGDDGFKPDFKDPHPGSRNQCGHFLTAVHLSFTPGIIFDASTAAYVVCGANYWNSLRAARYLAVGHEFIPDDGDFHNHRALFAGRKHELTFRDGVKAMYVPLGGSHGQAWANLDAAKKVLKQMPIDESQTGNSYADILLTAVGWLFSDLILSGEITTRAKAGDFVRQVLSVSAKAPPHPSTP